MGSMYVASVSFLLGQCCLVSKSRSVMKGSTPDEEVGNFEISKIKPA